MKKYEELRKQYPEYISKIQLYQICGISPLSATYLLQNGIIPCIDTGKRTWRYRIALEDVITYLKKREKTGSMIPRGAVSSRRNYQNGPRVSFSNLIAQGGEQEIAEYFSFIYYGAWRAMEELYQQKKVRAIGVSNFESDRLIDLIMHNTVVPAVNQIEIHPFFQQNEARRILNEYGVQPEAWAPFAEGQMDIFHNNALSEIGKKYAKSIAQVILRWHIQQGIVAIPKSVHKSRIEENYAIWDFELSQEDMLKISTLDLGKSSIIDFHNIDTVKWLGGHKIHN